MNERLYIKEILHDLHYKDLRSIKRWCNNQNIPLRKDKGSNKLYVLKEEYESAKCRNYPKSNQILNSTINFPLENQDKRKSEYKTQFENERRMLSILLKI